MSSVNLCGQAPGSPRPPGTTCNITLAPIEVPDVGGTVVISETFANVEDGEDTNVDVDMDTGTGYYFVESDNDEDIA